MSRRRKRETLVEGRNIVKQYQLARLPSVMIGYMGETPDHVPEVVRQYRPEASPDRWPASTTPQ